MSETYDQIITRIKESLKAGKMLEVGVLRMVVSDIKNMTVTEGKEITEDIVVSCLKKYAKQVEDSVVSAKAANREDLVERARQELDIVSKFLPKMMTEKQMEELCEDLYAHIPGTKFGDLIKMLPSNCDKKFCAKVFQGLLKVEKQQAFLSVRKK